MRERIDENPLRAFDSKDEETQAVMANAPLLVDRLDQEDAEHFAEVRTLLDQSGIDYELDGTLVRGLDYYTRTVFEFESEALDAQARTIGGGGRYDRLVEALGGPATARLRLGGRDRADPAGDRRSRGGADRRRLRRPGLGSRAAAPSPSCASCAAPGCAPNSTSPGVRSRAR